VLLAQLRPENTAIYRAAKRAKKEQREYDITKDIHKRLTSRAQAQPPSGTLKSKMTNKFHKINGNWKGQRLLPAGKLKSGRPGGPNSCGSQ
jgi:hypothetical protein